MDRTEPVQVARAATAFGATGLNTALGETGLSVRYRSTFEDVWPVSRRVLTRIPMMWIQYAMMAFSFDVLIALALVRANPIAALFSLPFGWVVGVAVCHGILLAIIRTETWFRTRGKDRICATTLTRNGIIDEVPGKKVVLAWSQICSIKLIEGAVVFVTFIGGCHVPASAFQSDESRRVFMDRAIALWKSKGRAWPDIEREAQLA